MVQATPLTQLINLVKQDQEKRSIQQKITVLQKELATKEKQIAHAQEELVATKNSVEQAQKLVDQHELAVKEIDAKLQEKKEVQSSVTDNKQYQAIKKEIATLKDQQQEHETILVDAWKKLEQAKNNLSLVKEKTISFIEPLKEEIAAQKQQLQLLAKQLEQEEKNSKHLLTLLPEAWAEQYGTMQGKAEDPLVPITQNACSACFEELRPQELIDIKRKKVIRCAGCYRFLYDEQHVEQKA